MSKISLLADLREAVECELAIQQKKGRRHSTMTLQDGVRISEMSSGGAVYRFEIFTGSPPEEGTKVEVSIGTDSIIGRISSRDEKGFSLELSRDIGATISAAKLTSDPLFLLKMQVSYLTELSSSQSDIKSALALLNETEVSSVPQIDSWQETIEGLNDQQISAVRAVKVHPNVFIWGPPGTGKTTTIGSLVASAANSGLRVLVVSNTNTALDTAIHSTMPKIKSDILDSDGSVIRIGPLLKPELREKWGELIDFEKVLSRKIEEIRQKLQRENENLGLIRNRGRALNEVMKRWELLRKAKAELTTLGSEESKITTDIDIQLERRKGIKDKITSLLGEIEINKSKGFFGKMRARSEEKIRREIKSVTYQLDPVDKQIADLKRSLPMTQSQIAMKKVELSDILNEEALLPNYSETEVALKAARAELDASLAIVKLLEEELSEARKKIISAASIVGCTAYRPLIDQDLAPIKFDLVVIDEASMLPLSLLLIAAVRSTARIVIAGDFRQLPPIISLGDEIPGKKSSERDAYLGALLSNDAFHKGGVLARFNAGEPVPELIPLTDQYRMRSEISDLISDRFYTDHRLNTVNDLRNLSTPWGNETFITFNTESLEPESTTVESSRRNVVHAITIERIVEELVLAGWSLDGADFNSIGVISAFREQAKHTQRMLEARFGTIAKGVSQTIHKFQGSERGLIIIDMTRVGTKSDPGYGRFQANSEPFSDTNRKWNVAISRARQHVIVVNHIPTLAGSSDSVIASILREVQEKGILLDAGLLFEGELAKKLPKKFSSIDPDHLGIYKADDFYPAYERDLIGCQTSLLLVSPFITRNGAERWIPRFLELVKIGVRITVITKPLEEGMNQQVEGAVHSQLASVGIDLKLESGIHEKISIVDGKITWHGSLNILSHTAGTSEIMARFVSEEIAIDIQRELAAPSRFPLRSSAGTSMRKYANVQKLDDPCLRPGCDGTMNRLKINRATKERFLSCSNYGDQKNSCGWTSNPE